MEKYFVISANEDGECRVSVHTREELLDKLNDQWWGDLGEMKNLEDIKNFAYETGIFIIKGDQIFPEPKEVVQSWDIE